MKKPKDAREKLHVKLQVMPDAVRWRQAIEDARLNVVFHRKKIYALERAIRLMVHQAKVGEPWPKKPATEEAKVETQ